MSQKRAYKPRIYVHLTAVWGNGDADSTIKVSRRRWAQIQKGAEYTAGASSWYEGERASVGWHFLDAKVSINGPDGMECLIDHPVSDLIAEVVVPE